MNDNTSKLIEQLAAKMGTTSEYLWGVLLKQAPISATWTLLQVILVVVFGIMLYRAHISLSDDENDISYYNHDAINVIMATLLIIWLILVIASFFCLGDIFNGYMNPEFWALDYILNKIK
jgi:uncharacterized membrane protein